MKLFTFHTGGDYKTQAEGLKSSAMAVGLECEVIELPDLGSWWKNCNQKSGLVLEMLDKYGDEKIVWNDSDVRYISYPKLFDQIQDDFAAYFMTPQVCIGGTILFNGKAKAIRYVEAWAKNVRENPEQEDDSINFRRALKSVRPRNIYHLPPSYCWNEKHMRSQFPGTMPVIMHHYVGKHDYPVISVNDA